MSPLKRVAFGLLRPFRTPVTWACQRGLLPSSLRQILPWRWTIEPFTIYGNGWSCRWYPTEFDNIGRTVFWSGLREWEKETSRVMLEQIRVSRCFLDIGANCGIYTVLGCVVNRELRAVAFEPVPRIFTALKRNVTENGLASRAATINVALGTSNGIVKFHEAEDPTMGSMAVEGYRGESGTVIEVACRTLDSVVDELKLEPDFMKIDVEGFEHTVLAGATATLEHFRPRIVLEANPGDDAASVAAILSRFGYSFYSLTAEGPQRRDTIEPIAEYRNWLCLPPSRTAESSGYNRSSR